MSAAETISISGLINKINKSQNNNETISDPFWISKHYNFLNTKPIQWFLKRFLDIAGTTVGLFLIMPVFIVIAIAIKTESKGPVFFKQKRIGLNGNEFYMYKFRSMVVDAESRLDEIKHLNETNDGMFKLFNDPRVTNVGRFLRKYSLDELPQLLNVIRGEMSLVGPRPPIKKELKVYKNWHYIRFATLPGLTGMWQVSGRSRIKDFDNVVKLDYMYIDTWNFLLDIKILFKTLPIVILGKDSA